MAVALLALALLPGGCDTGGGTAGSPADTRGGPTGTADGAAGVAAPGDALAPADRASSAETASDAPGGLPDLRPAPETAAADLTAADREEAPPPCTPACRVPGESCVDGSCACAAGYHDGGDGACVPADACSEGFAMAADEAACRPVAELCPDDRPCQAFVGWADGACLYEPQRDGVPCEGHSADPCVSHFLCEAGSCVAQWPPCDEERRPVVLVHGINSQSEVWDVFVTRLVADGWPPEEIFLFNAADPSWGCNVDNAEAIRQLVEEARALTCQPRVDLVAHSMGGVSSRYFMKNLGGHALVNTYVTLGTMHHGLLSPCLAPDFLDVCVWKELCQWGDFVAQLNAEPAMPGDTWWVSIYSLADTKVPASSSELAGAENIVFEGVAHDGPEGLMQVEEVYEEVRRVLDYRCW